MKYKSALQWGGYAWTAVILSYMLLAKDQMTNFGAFFFAGLAIGGLVTLGRYITT